MLKQPKSLLLWWRCCKKNPLVLANFCRSYELISWVACLCDSRLFLRERFEPPTGTSQTDNTKVQSTRMRSAVLQSRRWKLRFSLQYTGVILAGNIAVNQLRQENRVLHWHYRSLYVVWERMDHSRGIKRQSWGDVTEVTETESEAEECRLRSRYKFTHSRHPCTPQPRFESCDSLLPSSSRLAHCACDRNL